MRHYFKFAFSSIVLLAFSVSHADTAVDFFRAVGLDDSRTVSRLLERGFDPNAIDENGQVGLFVALRVESPKVAGALLASAQTRIDQANANGETPLMIAALRGSVEWVQRLVERGAAVNREGWSPLHYAASGPEPRVAALLLERGAAVNARSPNGSTPLMMAARYGASESVALLRARGADLRLKNDQGLDAADFARAGGRDSLAIELERVAR